MPLRLSAIVVAASVFNIYICASKWLCKALFSAALCFDEMYGCFAVSKHYHRTEWADFNTVLRLTLRPKANWVGQPPGI